MCLAVGLTIGMGSAVALARRCFVVVRVVGVSMEPTLLANDLVLVRRNGGHGIQAGVLVVFPQPLGFPPPRWHSAESSAKLSGRPWMIKRVAAADGDEIPEIARRAVGGIPVVPPGMLVVLGDNIQSADSRVWGFLPEADVIGPVVWQLPISNGIASAFSRK